MKPYHRTCSYRPFFTVFHNLAQMAGLVLLTVSACFFTLETAEAQTSKSIQPRDLVKEVFPGMDLTGFSNHNDLAYGDADWVLANPGKAYLASGNTVDKIGVKGLPGGVWNLSWHDVKTGETFNQQIVAIIAGDYTFGKPDNIGNQALVYIFSAKDAWTPPGVK